MISVILWKEYRDQSMVWVTLAVLGVLLLVGLPFVLAANGLTDPAHEHEMRRAIAIGLPWLYGMISGVMLLAGERLAGTLTFLDTLPGLRRRLWLAKVLAGVVLVLAQIAFLMGVAAAARLFDDWSEAAWALGLMTYFGLFGFAWGLLFSSFGRNVMNLILVCFCAQLLAHLLAAVLLANVLFWMTIVLGIRYAGEPWPFLTAALGLTGLLAPPLALAGSALVFTRPDRRRLAEAEEPPAGRPGQPRFSWRVLFWLAWRQTQGFAAGLALFALFLGFFILAQGMTLWPLATTLLGVLCGVTAFADEQEGPFRYLGDQRLPLGRLWLVKVGVRFAVAVVAAVIVLTPSLVVALARAPETPQQQWPLFAHAFNSALLVSLCPPGLFLTMWLSYGFTAGCLFGLLFRNGLAAGVFALFTGVLLTAVWIPSLLHGGLHAWQVFGPPLLLLLASRLVLRPWAAGRVASWTTAVRLTPVCVLVGLWIAGALWYRVLEIPVAPAKYDLNAFEASLPKPEDNHAGELVRGACHRFDELSRQVQSQPPPGQPPSVELWNRASEADEHGWPAADPELGAWLDKLFAGDWLPMLREAADLPPGMVEDLRHETAVSPAPLLEQAHRIAVVLTARGLQRQAAGDDEAYVENLRIGLALSRALRHDAYPLEAGVGGGVEGTLVRGLDRWLEKLKGRPDLLHKALDLLTTYLEQTKGAGDDQMLVNYLIARNSLDDPLPLLVEYLTYYQQMTGRDNLRIRMEALWVAVSGQLIPWERERQDRLLRLMFEGTDEQRQSLLRDDAGMLAHSSLEMLIRLAYPHRPQTAVAPCWEQAMLLKLALRWYQADNGKPAENLDVLVPKYLKEIPPDPKDGRPFRYRLSGGEEIEWAEEPPTAPPHARKIPPGQGILWCVGEDGMDDGGHRQAGSTRTGQGEDMIFLVPLPPADR